MDETNALPPEFMELLDQLPDAVLIANRTGHIVLANLGMVALFGYAQSELQQMLIEQLVPPDRRDVHRRHRAAYHLMPYQRSMGTSHMALYGLRRDGTVFPVLISLGPFGDAHVVAVVRDARHDAERSAQFAAPLPPPYLLLCVCVCSGIALGAALVFALRRFVGGV